MNDNGTLQTTLSIVLGIVLVALGIGAYVLSDFASVTALIPAIFGVVITALGAIGRKTNRERLSIYGVGVLALLGVMGSLRGIPDIIALVTGESVDSSVAAISQGAMILISLVLVLAVGKYVLDER
ncbi:hypothetical protein [Halostagnicola sp. A-GB9-2]|uniref:hypothetical protein n=1 Tax=Halostagnicola sp. A-GB9-2 TaxID=3048066 RepID=UPI0024C020FA|nr:hypothetical protein [Halostagnicola sp. A-GB9-2]MDJ1432956.1 hypothetical protein [Halostagnicola sp. A-GB9-2]